MLSWLVDKPADIVKSKQMVVNARPVANPLVFPATPVTAFCTLRAPVWQNQSMPFKLSTGWEKKARSGLGEPGARHSGDGEKESFDRCAPSRRLPSWASCEMFLPSLPTDVSTWQGCWISLFFIWPGPRRSITLALAYALSANVFTI